ncbi:MAG: DciA family protein [Planctomycetota bacterium]
MKKGRSRCEILEANGLLQAPQASQSLFWLRRRRDWRGRGISKLGDMAERVVSDGALRLSAGLMCVAEAWHRVVPESYAARTRVESLWNGRLVVRVDAKATGYHLSRRFGPRLVEALNEVLRRDSDAPSVRSVRYRIGSVPGGDTVNESEERAYVG